MGPSQVIVAPGLRTSARPGWRSGVATALAVVAGQPSLWVLGALGFLLRGGIVLMTLAILVLPSPVAVRLLLGDMLGSSGFTPAFFVTVGGGLVLLGSLVLLAMLLLALVEVAAFERFISSEDGAPTSSSADPRAVASRRRIVAALFAIQIVALLALLATATPLVAVAGQATYAELMRPSLGGGVLYERVLAQIGGVVLVVLAALVIIEAVSAVASRRLLAQAYALSGRPNTGADPALRLPGSLDLLRAVAGAIARPLLRPSSVLPTALVGWLSALVMLAPVAWALEFVWRSARSVLLAGRPLDSGLAGSLAVTLLLVVAWLGALALAGFVSALRAALWTSEELR